MTNHIDTERRKSEMLSVIQHSLGVDKFGQGDQYRDHFVTGEGSTDWPICMEATGLGFMKRHASPAHFGGNDFFIVTDAGRVWMAENSPPAPKLTRGQRRYREWLNISDVYDISFIDYCRRKIA
jgi:hypothetical protein